MSTGGIINRNSIQPDEVVHLHAHHIERFTTMPKDTTEGLGSVSLSQAFELPEADRRYLDRLGLTWDCIKGGRNPLAHCPWVANTRRLQPSASGLGAYDPSALPRRAD